MKNKLENTKNEQNKKHFASKILSLLYKNI